MSKSAVCLLSGGLDSSTVAYFAHKEGWDIYALTVDYGQIHARELHSARLITEKLCVKEHEVISIGLPWKGSALLDSEIAIGRSRSLHEMSQNIPATYVPARNTVLISLAASFAEAKGAQSIFVGANAVDYSGYPDCRPQYFKAMQETLRQGTKCGIEGKEIQLVAPLIHMTKADIVRLGVSLQVPYELTWSCYQGQRDPCGECDSCLLRAKGFLEAGFIDPLLSSSHQAYGANRA